MFREEIRQAVRIGATFMGAVIGAGFATGQEIMQFFTVYGTGGLWGICLATALFCLFGMTVLWVTKRIRGISYHDFLQYFFGAKAARYIDMVMAGSLLLGLGVMLAGSGALFAEHLNMPPAWGIALTVICTGLVILGGITRIQQVNLVLMPVIVVFTISLAWRVWGSFPDAALPQGTLAEARVAPNWMTASILYVAYNMILTVVILSSLGHRLPTRVYLVGGAIGALGLGLLAGLINVVVLAFFPEVTHYQVPMLYIAGKVNPGLHKLYIFIIWIAIVTTAIANAYGFAKRVEACTGWPHGWIGLGATVAVLPMVAFDFMELIKRVYPFLGYLGILLFLGILGRPLWLLVARVDR